MHWQGFHTHLTNTIEHSLLIFQGFVMPCPANAVKSIIFEKRIVQKLIFAQLVT